MALIILRCLFLMVATGLGVFFINSGIIPADAAWGPWLAFGGMFLLAVAVIVLDVVAAAKAWTPFPPSTSAWSWDCSWPTSSAWP